MNKLNRIAFFVAMSMISLVCGIQVWRWLSPSENVTTVTTTTPNPEPQPRVVAKITGGLSKGEDQKVSDELAGPASEAEVPEELAEELDRELVRKESKIVAEQVAGINKWLNEPSDFPDVREAQDFMRPGMEQVNEKVIRMNELIDGPLTRDDMVQVGEIWNQLQTKIDLMKNAIKERNKELEQSLRNLKRR